MNFPSYLRSAVDLVSPIPSFSNAEVSRESERAGRFNQGMNPNDPVELPSMTSLSSVTRMAGTLSAYVPHQLACAGLTRTTGTIAGEAAKAWAASSPYAAGYALACIAFLNVSRVVVMTVRSLRTSAAKKTLADKAAAGIEADARLILGETQAYPEALEQKLQSARIRRLSDQAMFATALLACNLGAVALNFSKHSQDVSHPTRDAWAQLLTLLTVRNFVYATLRDAMQSYFSISTGGAAWPTSHQLTPLAIVYAIMQGTIAGGPGMDYGTAWIKGVKDPVLRKLLGFSMASMINAIPEVLDTSAYEVLLGYLAAKRSLNPEMELTRFKIGSPNINVMADKFWNQSVTREGLLDMLGMVISSFDMLITARWPNLAQPDPGSSVNWKRSVATGAFTSAAFAMAYTGIVRIWQSFAAVRNVPSDLHEARSIVGGGSGLNINSPEGSAAEGGRTGSNARGQGSTTDSSTPARANRAGSPANNIIQAVVIPASNHALTSSTDSDVSISISAQSHALVKRNGLESAYAPGVSGNAGAADSDRTGGRDADATDETGIKTVAVPLREQDGSRSLFEPDASSSRARGSMSPRNGESSEGGVATQKVITAAATQSGVISPSFLHGDDQDTRAPASTDKNGVPPTGLTHVSFNPTGTVDRIRGKSSVIVEHASSKKPGPDPRSTDDAFRTSAAVGSKFMQHVVPAPPVSQVNTRSNAANTKTAGPRQPVDAGARIDVVPKHETDIELDLNLNEWLSSKFSSTILDTDTFAKGLVWPSQTVSGQRASSGTAQQSSTEKAIAPQMVRRTIGDSSRSVGRESAAAQLAATRVQADGSAPGAFPPLASPRNDGGLTNASELRRPKKQGLIALFSSNRRPPVRRTASLVQSGLPAASPQRDAPEGDDARSGNQAEANPPGRKTLSQRLTARFARLRPQPPLEAATLPSARSAKGTSGAATISRDEQTGDPARREGGKSSLRTRIKGALARLSKAEEFRGNPRKGRLAGTDPSSDKF